ncbi:two-component response regulator [Gracilibacillus halophilus YIM-C55.5]|uniref:Two-component response regulator n=1 Tax=Gracilibacillus halophilus YIM-C55.5 TaxID=1308866 RepID=N4WP30_9BACI|nr:response regulator [Gracilibacillus halophilus]ENH96245.1 two-component response regulator [Gracilibacillus halophilus YIM-C55.5]
MDIILFDDEILALDYLEHQLNALENTTIIGKYTHTDVEAIKETIKLADVVFLDIKMPDINGLELAEKILEIKPSIPIIFVTAYDEYAIQAFELNALDYILKPVQFDRLKKTIERIEHSIRHKNDQIQADAQQLTIHVLGELSFQMDDEEPEVISWRTANAKQLFLYLLHHHDQSVSKSELIELLLDHTEIEKADSLLYVTIYQIRQALSKYCNYLSIVNRKNAYALILYEHTTIDKERWETALTNMPTIDSETIYQHEQTLHLYKGAYLKNLDYVWAEAERFRIEKLWIEHALKIADCYYTHQFYEKAANWYVQISDIVPELENVHFALMKIHDINNYGILVEHQYHLLSTALDEFNLSMSDEVEQWYQEWKQTNKQKLT